MYQHRRRLKLAVACICGIGLSGCQVAGGPISGPAEPPAPVAPAQVTVEPQPEPQTITIIKHEASPALVELAGFASASIDDRKAMLANLKQDYDDYPTAENALRYGGSLAIAALSERNLRGAEALLQLAANDGSSGLATVLLDQTRKRLDLLVSSRQKQSPEPETQIPETSQQVAEQNETINRLQLDNTQLRSALSEAEAKLRELAQIETELAKPKTKTSP